jgi:hypothetical protein
VKKPESKFAFQVHNLQRYSAAGMMQMGGAGAGGYGGGGGYGDMGPVLTPEQQQQQWQQQQEHAIQQQQAGWVALTHTDPTPALSSSGGVFFTTKITPYYHTRVAAPGCQIGYVGGLQLTSGGCEIRHTDHPGCHQLVFFLP